MTRESITCVFRVCRLSIFSGVTCSWRAHLHDVALICTLWTAQGFSPYPPRCEAALRAPLRGLRAVDSSAVAQPPPAPVPLRLVGLSRTRASESAACRSRLPPPDISCWLDSGRLAGSSPRSSALLRTPPSAGGHLLKCRGRPPVPGDPASARGRARRSRGAQRIDSAAEAHPPQVLPVAPLPRAAAAASGGCGA
eukprot:scaffold128_cov248-Pinguiococcus_pyrenoidosus.AAC.34